MPKILVKKELAKGVKLFEVEAPRIARKRKAGQFVVVRAGERGERIPLTIAGSDPARGSITLVFQEAGKSTIEMGRMEAGEELLDVAGPLGRPTHVERFGVVAAIGGGIGVAPVKPIAEAMKAAGNRVIGIIGARTKDLVILEEEMRAASDELLVSTDDGSYGRKGFVSDVLKGLLDAGRRIDLVVAIGPVPMMRAVVAVAKERNLPAVVSLNPIMVDGTGMCGGCRVTVGGQTKFVCVDGPEFDGHKVDFDELVKRQATYKAEEAESRRIFDEGCRLAGEGRG